MALKVCQNCHAECENDAAGFCPYCGYALNGNEGKAQYKKHSTLKTVLLICLAVFLSPILLFAGCMSCSAVVSSMQPEPQQIKVGEPFICDEIEYTIDSVEYENNFDDDGYLRLSYTAFNRDDEARGIFSLPGSLYAPDGKSVESKWVPSLDMYAPTTDEVLPGYSTNGSETWEIAGSGNYTLLIDDSKMEFTVQLPDDNSEEIVLTYETSDGTETQSFAI